MKDVKMKICTSLDLAWYNHSEIEEGDPNKQWRDWLCLDGRDNLIMSKNWFYEKGFRAISVILDSCNPRFYDGTCKS